MSALPPPFPRYCTRARRRDGACSAGDDAALREDGVRMPRDHVRDAVGPSAAVPPRLQQRTAPRRRLLSQRGRGTPRRRCPLPRDHVWNAASRRRPPEIAPEHRAETAPAQPARTPAFPDGGGGGGGSSACVPLVSSAGGGGGGSSCCGSSVGGCVVVEVSVAGSVGGGSAGGAGGAGSGARVIVIGRGAGAAGAGAGAGADDIIGGGMVPTCVGWGAVIGGSAAGFSANAEVVS